VPRVRVYAWKECKKRKSLAGTNKATDNALCRQRDIAFVIDTSLLKPPFVFLDLCFLFPTTASPFFKAATCILLLFGLPSSPL
jgi:hypothetical protein